MSGRGGKADAPGPIRFSIADIVFDLVCDLPAARFDFTRPYALFETPGSGPSADLRIRLIHGDAPEGLLKRARRVFDSQTHWKLFEDNRSILLELGSAFDAWPRRIAVFDPDLRQADLYCGPSAPATTRPTQLPDPLEYPLGQLLMVLLLSRGRGLMVHACGVDYNGAGYLFAGNSTDGKTTMANLWAPASRVLNDDRIVVRRNGDRFWMYGTPWHGDFESVAPHGLPIERIFFLRHGPDNRAEAVGGAEAAVSILTRCFAPFWSKEGMAFTLDFCRQVVHSVPCSTLAFRPDRTVVDFVTCKP